MAKKVFRLEQHRATKAQEREYVEKIIEAFDIDQKTFWQQINKRRKQRSQTVHPVVDPNGHIAGDIHSILNTWQHYYENLCSGTESESYDQNFKEMVDSAIAEIGLTPSSEDTDTLRTPITVEEVKMVCQELKNGKASGYDGLQPDHLKKLRSHATTVLG